MAVAFDAVGPAGGAGAATTTAGPLTWAHINSDAGNAIIVGVNYKTGTTPETTAVTYGAVSLSRLGTVPGNNVGPGGIELWGKIGGLPTGSNTVSVTFSTGATNNTTGGSISFTAAGAFGAVFTAFASGASVSVSVTGTTSGNMIVAAGSFGSNGTTMSANSPGTLRWSANGDGLGGANNTVGGTWASPGGTQAVGFSSTGSDFWGLVAVEVQAGGAAAQPSVPIPHGGRYWRHNRKWRKRLTPVIDMGQPAAVPPGAAALAASIDLTAPPAITQQEEAGTSLAADVSITVPSAQLLAPATLLAAAVVSSPAAVQLAPVTLAVATVAAGPVSAQLAPAALAAAWSAAAPSVLVENVAATLAASWALAAPAAQLAPAALQAGFAVASPPARQLAPASLAAGLTISSPAAALAAPAALAAAWSMTAVTAQLAPASLAAAFALGSPAAGLAAPASMIITGSLTGSAGQGASLAAGFSLASPAVQLAPASLAAALAISDSAIQDAFAVLAAGLAVAAPGVSLRAPATLAAATSLAGPGAILAPAALAAQSVLAAAAGQLAPASLAAQVSVNSPVTAELAAAVLSAAAVLGTVAPPAAGAAVLPAQWALTASGIMIPAQIISGLRAGQPRLAWSAGQPHLAWAAGAAHLAWAAAEPHGTGYAAGNPHSAWAAGEPHS